MKTLFKISLYTLTAILFCCISSCMQNATFSEDELRFAKPYSKTDTAIYQSEKGLVDTIIFQQAIIDTFRPRSIEQGFYNELTLRVSYKLSTNSYHKLTVFSKNNEPENFIQFSKAKGSHQNKEINFLGMNFSDEYVEKIDVSNKDEITFRAENAAYNEANINAGISSFVFDFDKGITSFVDINNVKWILK